MDHLLIIAKSNMHTTKDFLQLTNEDNMIWEDEVTDTQRSN